MLAALPAMYRTTACLVEMKQKPGSKSVSLSFGNHSGESA
jgi:hypothetical protein